MPHNIFLHSALVQSRKIDMTQPAAKREAILYNAVESGASLAITVVINLFVMSVFAVGFFGKLEGAQVGLSNAGKCARFQWQLLQANGLVDACACWLRQPCIAKRK